MRELVKKAAERLLVDSGASGVVRRLTRRSVILAYHNVVPAGSGPTGDASLHIEEHQFAHQLDHLSSTHTIVPLRELVFGSEDSDRNRAAISFDDAYRGAIRIGAREIEKRGLSATIFVAPGLLGDRALWWDVLASPPGGLASDLRARILDDMEGRQADALEWASARGMSVDPLPDHARTATEEEVLAAAETPGIQLEAHGWLHANMACIDPDEIKMEYEKVAGWLEEKAGVRRPLLAYPYGRVSPEAEASAREYFRGAVLVSGGTFDPETLSNEYRIPRVNVAANLSLRGFDLRISGF